MPINPKALPKSHARKKLHLECVICGDNFGALYDEELKAFPNFHTQEYKPDKECYDKFYGILFSIYQYLYEQEQSVSINKFMEDFEWPYEIHQKKLMLIWCLVNGFLQVDDFKRLVLPASVENSFELLEVQMSNPGYLDKFIRKQKGEMKGVDPDQMPFKADNTSKSKRPTVFS